MNGEKEYTETRLMLEKVRKMGNSKPALLKEEKEEKETIPITDDSKFGNRVKSTQIDAIRKGIQGALKAKQRGGQTASVAISFENGKTTDSSPLIYYPDDNDLKFFANAIFELGGSVKYGIKLIYSIKNGCNIIMDNPIILSEDLIYCFIAINSYYNNWYEQWSNDINDLKKNS